MKIQDYYKNRDSFSNEKRWDYDRRARKAINKRIEELAQLLGIEKDKFSDLVFSEKCPDNFLREVFTTDIIRLIFKIFEKALLLAKWDEPPNKIEKGGGKIGAVREREKRPVVDIRRGKKVYGQLVLPPHGFKIVGEELEFKVNWSQYDYKAVEQEAYLKEFMLTIMKYYEKSQKQEEEFQTHREFLVKFGLPSNLHAKLSDLEGDLSSCEVESNCLREFIEKEGLINKYNLKKKHELEKKIKERRKEEILRKLL